MSAATTRLAHSEAAALAWELVALLGPYCERIEIAGSLRRQRPSIGDIELVCLPMYGRPTVDLFGETAGPGQNLLDLQCDWLFEQGVIGKRYDKNGRPRWGSGLKWATYSDVAVDLFPVVGPTATWGVDFLLRTGSARFSQRFVTPTEQGGWMAPGMNCQGGALWRAGQADPIETPEESDVFRAIGRPFVPPERREV